MKEIPDQVITAFQGVDLILHAGDVQVPRALDWLERIAPVICARGNNDGFMDDPRMKPVQLLHLEGLTVAVIHTFTYPKLALDYYYANHFKEKVDVVVYGDSHMERVDWEDGLLMVNPGSPTSPGPNMPVALGSVAILEINEGKAEARIVQIRDLPLP
jgi:putative phosphoesterase